MLNKLNSIIFYLSFFTFIVNIIIYFMGFIQIIDALNNALVIFGFIGLTLGLKLTKNTPAILKIFMVGLIASGSVLWTISIFKIIDFAIYWKYALLLIFSGIIWAIWNKVFFKGSFILRLVLTVSALMLLICTILTCFSFFDNSDFLFYSLIIFTSSALLTLFLNYKKVKKEKQLNP